MQPGTIAATHRADQIRALSARSIGKRFPGVTALNDVSFDLWTGEVHSLVGENGAGKSTLIKMVTGADRPDTGTLEFFGSRSVAEEPHQRRLAGVSAIYQELMIAPEMSAAANVFLHGPPRRGFMIDRSAMRNGFVALAKRLGLTIDPDIRAGSLSIADRQMIEIMRALTTRCRLLIMDEPTAALGPSERLKLFEVVAELRREGTAIIYISHDLDEVLRISDRISVMRNGELVATAARADWTKERMVAAMIGGKSAVSFPRAKTERGKEVLRVEDLVVPGRLAGVSFSVGEGEILGVAGLVGSGRTELLRAIAGADPRASGRLALNGVSEGLFASVRAAVAKGIVLVPEDRKAQGFIPLLSGTRNVALTNLPSISRAGIVSDTASAALAQATTQPLRFAPDRLGQAVRTLSGGNQQKLVIGKWLHRKPKLLLLDEPTRGVDIGAKAEIYAAIRRLAEDGLAVILVSSEFQELIEQADRMIVLARGGVTATLSREKATIERILSLIFAVEGTSR
jgi:ABC-type sugar transport system ATPase subunit